MTNATKSFLMTRLGALHAIGWLIYSIVRINRPWGWVAVVLWSVMLGMFFALAHAQEVTNAYRQGVPGNNPGTGNISSTPTFTNVTLTISGTTLASATTYLPAGTLSLGVPDPVEEYAGPDWARTDPDSIPESERTSSSGIAEPPTFSGARLYGYRAFGSSDGYLLPVSGSPRQFEGPEMDAVCRIHHYGGAPAAMLIDRHAAPFEPCRCGLYAMWVAGEAQSDPPLMAYGLVEASGKVIPADRGWRAAHQTLLGLYIPNTWPSPRPLAWIEHLQERGEYRKRYGVPVFGKWEKFLAWAEKRVQEGEQDG